MKQLVIDRKTWLCGDELRSYLLRASDRKMCCLGFYSLQLGGLKRKQILDIYSPETVMECIPQRKRRGGFVKAFGELLKTEDDPYCIENSKLCNQLMRTNDDAALRPKTRETRIAKLFAKMGVKVTYKGESPNDETK